MSLLRMLLYCNIHTFKSKGKPWYLNVLTKVSSGSSTIFAKKGFVSKDENNLILLVTLI